jgi:hypothetical protein
MNYDVTDNEGFTQTTTLRIVRNKTSGDIIRIEQRWVKTDVQCAFGIYATEEVWKPVEDRDG